jgi:hypothetical protein
MEFRELSDFEWEVINLLLPPVSRVGRPYKVTYMFLAVVRVSLGPYTGSYQDYHL